MPSVKRAFQAFSETGDGRLTTAQTAKFLGHFNIAESCALKAADAMDLDRDGSIDWTEFVAACTYLGGEDFDKALWEIFRGADSDGDNLLSQSDLGKLLPPDHSGEVAKDVFHCLTGRTEQGARVDWSTFRMHFKSIDDECGAGGSDTEDAVGVAQPVALPGGLVGLPLGPACFKQAFDVVEQFCRGFFPAPEPELQQQQQQRRQQAFPGLQQQLVETTAAPNVEVQEQDLRHLAEMGFSNREMCVAVLQRHRNELSHSAIEELCNN
jgi:Ca2+-binding EF-hand superfamily protein